MLKAILVLLGLTAIVTIMALTTIAEPYGPYAYTNGTSERNNFSSQAGMGAAAQAGNVTEITINTTIVTKRWQGYFGNITGKITLDDASGNTMYDWASESLSVVGEIYAANATVSNWGDVICLNLTGNGTSMDGASMLNATILETMYGMNDSADGINETFLNTGDIRIGSTALRECPTTYIYQDDAQVTGTWNETLLTENSTHTVIFASQVEQNTAGFDNLPWDFQMIVGDNDGYTGGTTTTYFFYVELA